MLINKIRRTHKCAAVLGVISQQAVRTVRMKKHNEIKRNHHYVWGHYLRRWADNNNVFYISQRGKISNDSIKGLAKEIDFYKINPLNSEDVGYIRRFSSYSPEFLREIHESHLKHFIQLSSISNAILKLEIKSEDLKFIDSSIKNNSLENLHSIFEDTAVNVINELSKGNKNVLNENANMIPFCSYIGHQISRTQAFKEQSLKAVAAGMSRINANPEYFALFEKNWWFLSFIFGLNIGMSLYESKERDKHVFITNNTAIPFVTSDNPIINIHKSLAEIAELEAPTKADLLIPLSPKYAYMINNSSDYDHLEDSITTEEVNDLNRAVYNKSYKTVFASERQVLSELLAYNKSIKNRSGPKTASAGRANARLL